MSLKYMRIVSVQLHIFTEQQFIGSIFPIYTLNAVIKVDSYSYCVGRFYHWKLEHYTMHLSSVLYYVFRAYLRRKKLGDNFADRSQFWLAVTT